MTGTPGRERSRELRCWGLLGDTVNFQPGGSLPGGLEKQSCIPGFVVLGERSCGEVAAARSGNNNALQHSPLRASRESGQKSQRSGEQSPPWGFLASFPTRVR